MWVFLFLEMYTVKLAMDNFFYLNFSFRSKYWRHSLMAVEKMTSSAYKLI